MEDIDLMNDENKKKRFTRMNQVHSSYHDFVCYLALEQDTGLQVFWYEFLNDTMTESDIEKGYKQLQRARQVSSPHLMNILDVWRDDSSSKLFVVTEGTQAPSLYDYLHSIESPPLTRTLIKWFRLLALAVHDLHHSQITHGSITLHNVFIKPATGMLKLRFPLTSLSCRSISQSAIDINQYTSPEKLNGTSGQLTDIWALGICFLEVLTQKPAYDEYKSPQELISAINSFTLPKAINEVDNQAAVSLIRQCLSPELTRPTIDQLLEDPVFAGEILLQPLLSMPTSQSASTSASNLMSNSMTNSMTNSMPILTPMTNSNNYNQNQNQNSNGSIQIIVQNDQEND